MQNDFNKALDKCREEIDVLQEFVQQDKEGWVRKLEALMEQLQIHVKDQYNTISLLKHVLASGPRTMETMKIWMKDPETFNETCDAKFLGNFCWDVEHYLDQMNGSSNEDNVNDATMFLIGKTKLWWRNHAEDVGVG